MELSGQFRTPTAFLFIPEERDPSIHWVGGWMDPRADLDSGAKIKKYPSQFLPGIERWSSSQ
jgi:hypothetical protein